MANMAEEQGRDRLSGILGLYTGYLIKSGIISNISHRQLANATISFLQSYSEEDFDRIVGEARERWEKGEPLPSEEEVNTIIYKNSKSPSTHN